MFRDSIKLKNKSIIINGGLGLIGSQVSQRCLEAGANILIIDNNKKASKLFIRANEKYKKNYKIIIKNSAEKRSISPIFREIKKFKNFNTFVNCAYPRDKYWYENTFDGKNLNSFINNIKLNFISNVWFTKEIAEYFKANKIKSSIILFSSIYGMVGQDLEIYNNSEIKENISYSLIKGGILNYTRLMASYYSKNDIRINSISPGGVRNNNNKLQDKQFLRNYSKRVPIKRMAQPDEIAKLIYYLSSSENTYITNEVISISGGE